MIFAIMNVACSFSYYLITFYVKYLPGSIFTNQIVSSLAEAFACLSTLIILKWMSIKNGFAMSFFVSGLACVCVMYAQATGKDWMVPLGVLGAKSGVAIAFAFLYFSMVFYFQSAFLGFVMGISNVIGRSSTILAPMVAEMSDPVPMVSSTFICCIAFALCIMLEKPATMS